MKEAALVACAAVLFLVATTGCGYANSAYKTGAGCPVRFCLGGRHFRSHSRGRDSNRFNRDTQNEQLGTIGEILAGVVAILLGVIVAWAVVSGSATPSLPW
jgi:hypothetical protein